MSLKKKISLAICGVLIVGLGAFAFYFMFMISPIAIFKTAVNNLYADLEKALERETVIDVENFAFDARINIDTSMDGFESLKNYNLDLRLANNSEENSVLVGAEITKADEKLIEGIVYLLNNQGYLSLPGISHRLFNLGPIDETLNEIDFDFNNINSENILAITKAIKDIYLETLTKDQFEQTTERITVNDREINAKKITYTVTKEDAQRISNEMVDAILETNELLEKIAEIANIDVSEIKEALTEMKDPNIDDFTTFEINLYLTRFTNNALKMEIKDEENTIEIIENKNETTIKFSNDNDNIEFTITLKDDSFNIEFKSEEVTFDLSSIYEEDNDKGTGKIIINSKIDEETLRVEMNYNIQSPGTMPWINTSIAVGIDQLNETEMLNLFERIMKLEFLEGLPLEYLFQN